MRARATCWHYGGAVLVRRPDLVIFDCDGVLVDTERLTVDVEARVLTELGWPHTPAEVVERWMGRAANAQLDDVAARLGTAVARRFDEVTTREIHDRFRRELTAVPGVREALDRLDEAGLRYCVASSGSHAKIRLTLGLTGLLARFESAIFSADDVAHGKPAPDLFLHAASRTGTAPVDCVVVEDSVHGVAAGVAAGIPVLGFTGGLAPAGALAAAGAGELPSMAQLPTLLGLEVDSASGQAAVRQSAK